MSVIGWIVVGLIAGLLATRLINRSGEGLVLDLVLGIAGGVSGGFVFSVFGAPPSSGLNVTSLFVAVVGAAIVLMLYHVIFGWQRST